MKKRLICILLLTGLFCRLQAGAGERPNVLLIYTDDQRYTGVHALGGEAVLTPHLDRLAESGIVFTHAYLQGAFSGASCIPSRAMLHSGRDLFHLDGIGYRIPEKDTTIGEAFMQAGYHAHFIGKWHQDMKSLTRSFNSGGKVSGKPRYLEDQFRMPYSDWNAAGNYPPENCYLLQYNPEGQVFRRPLTPEDKRGPTGTEKTGPHVAQVLADDAVSFLKHYDEAAPFFIYLAFPTPHDPRQAPQKYLDRYPPASIKLPPSFMRQHPFDNGHLVLRDEKLAPWPRTREVIRRHLAEYYASITWLDAQIGRVIAELKARGLYENTLIVMASDSGLAIGNHGLMGKQNIYDEDGIHVPFIMAGGPLQDADRGRRVGAFCYIHDIYPTLCDLTGIPIPGSVTGKSLAPVIRGETDHIRLSTYHAYRQHQRALRKGDFKLIEYVRAPDHDKERGDFAAGSRVTQLFNITDDPWETYNLADFPEYRETVETLRSEMKAQAAAFGDKPDGYRTKVDFWQYF